MSTPPISTDIVGQMVMLGTGTSVGVPAIGCGCPVCQSDHARNQRTRSSVVLGLPEGNLLIDTSPDLRTQLLREKIGVIHAVVYTHEHADHIFGFDDLRLFPFYLGHAVPIYCEAQVEDRLRRSYDYAFSPPPNMHEGGVPSVKLHRIGTAPFELLGARIVPIRMNHGPNFQVLGFRVGRVAYCTDANAISAESLELLADLDVLVLGALRNRPHATHFSLSEAVAVARGLRPGRTLFTHASHELDYETTNASLPAGMELSYDGLRIPLT